MSWWAEVGNMFQSGAKEGHGGEPKAGENAPRAGGEGARLRQAARHTDGFDAQEALFQPPSAPTKRSNGTEAPDAAVSNVPEPDLPRDFTNEGVLGTWIAQFNESLAKQTDKKGRNPKLTKLKGLGWADANGLNLDLLKAAAASWEPRQTRARKKPKGGESDGADKGAPPPATTAKVLAMLAESNAVLRKVIDKDYPGKCLEFSEKMLVELGAKRADGSTDREKKTAKAGPLTAQYRGKNVKDLPRDLPPGYQIGITSMPEWGFTEVGNHWFVSAGDGFYADNTGGIFTGAGMTANLRKAAAEQWAARVVDKDFGGTYAKIRAEMGTKFVAANPQFREYSKSGRTLVEKQKELKVKRDGKQVREANPDHKDTTALEAEGFAAIKAFVLGNATYHPRIWLVEPTTKVDQGT